MGGSASSPGEVEAWGLMQAALRMKESREGNQPDEIMLAVRLNWRLWTIFQADLLDPDCRIPDEIQMNLLSLANFIDHHTVAFLSDPEPEKLDILISINREIAGGLYESLNKDKKSTLELVKSKPTEGSPAVKTPDDHDPIQHVKVSA